ncbi:hypothetical protein RchiOBHm_Chr1g0372831 [Rosa chinensis]|uniref:Uncharacterized protein n=1 Tax=Rosa chinensis TaxID=74649 RepID=A0A2P6SLZ2_ROSCH|nr:hypothetical protein RchiOBHm_Chr1g0372831 [Rosa chinensis]
MQFSLSKLAWVSIILLSRPLILDIAALINRRNAQIRELIVALTGIIDTPKG